MIGRAPYEGLVAISWRGAGLNIETSTHKSSSQVSFMAVPLLHTAQHYREMKAKLQEEGEGWSAIRIREKKSHQGTFSPSHCTHSGLSDPMIYAYSHSATQLCSLGQQRISLISLAHDRYRNTAIMPPFFWSKYPTLFQFFLGRNCSPFFAIQFTCFWLSSSWTCGTQDGLSEGPDGGLSSAKNGRTVTSIVLDP